MKGDYSRIPFNERKKMQHYRKVYLQQGKVLLDSDLNENTDLLHYQMKTLAKDGLCGSPNIGFRIGRGVPLLPVDDHRYIGEGYYLFSLNPNEYRQYLKEGLVSNELSKAFEDNQQPLTSNARLTLRDEKKWTIKDGMKEYRIEDSDKELNIYGEGEGWSVKNGNGTLTINYFEKFEGKGSLKLENATKNTELSFAFQKPVDLSQYRYLRLALKTTGANPDLILKRFDGKNQTTIKIETKKEQSTDQNKFSVIKYTPLDAVLDNITEICLSGFSKTTVDLLIGAVECSPPMFTLELMTHLEGWSFEPAGSANVSIEDINGGGIIATQTEKLYKKHFSTVDFSKFETMEFAIKSSSTSAIEFYITDKDGNVSYWKIKKLSKKLKKYSKKIIRPDGKDSDTPAELAFIKEYGFRGLSTAASYGFGSILYERSLKNNFVISGTDPLSGETGRLYVDGELYEKEEAETYQNQKDYPSAPLMEPPAQGNTRTDLVYVDVWQRHVTSAEDPELREVAVGVDTCNRMKAVAQVKVLKGETSLPYDLKPTGGGRLSTVVEYMEVEKPCEITSGVEYTGAENRLYRVEIHEGGAIGTATYKWSKDNASTVSQIIENVKGNAKSVKVKDVKLFKKGDVIEITDDRVELADRKYISKKSSIKPWGELRKIRSIDRDKNELEWDDTASDDPLSMGLPHDYIAEGVETTHPRVIKWDGDQKTSSEEKLEDGIKIRFSGSDMLPGDYWTFTARGNTRAVEKLDNEPPQGVVHHYYPLAEITWDENGEIKTIADLRTRFEPLCGLTAADLAFDNANTPIWEDAENVQQALERVTFPLAAGIVFANKCSDLYGKSTNNVQAALDNLCDGITVPSLTLKYNDIAQSRWPKLKCSDSGDISFLAGAESLVERMRICADGNVGIGTPKPEARLHVNDGDILLGNNQAVMFEDNGGSNHRILRLDGNNDVTLWNPKRGANNDIYFGTGPIGSSNIRMGVKGGGNVGIGTTDPEARLDIAKMGENLWLRLGDGGDSGRLWVEYGKQLAPLLVMSDFDEPPRIQFQQIGTKKEDDPEFKSWIGHAKSKSNDIAIMGGNVGIGTAVPRRILDVDGQITIRPGDLANAGIWLKNTSNQDEWFMGKTNLAGKNQIGFWKNDWRMVIEDNGNVGIDTTDPGNDRLDVRGRCYSSEGWRTTNADYAEYFESADGSAIPVGTSVTSTKDGKVRPAKKGEIPIGIITTNSAIVGNSYKEWPKKYLRDEFGNLIMEDYEEEVMISKKERITNERQKVEKKTITEEVTRTEIALENGKYIQKEISKTITREVEEPLFEEVDLYDATGKNVIGKHRAPVLESYEEEIEVLDEKGQPVLGGSGEFVPKKRPKLNPDYDESKKYVSREDRPEWNCVGLLGQLPLREGQPVAPTWIKIKDISKNVELWLVR